MPPRIDPKYEGLSDEAWERLASAARTATATLEDGTVVSFKPHELLELWKWLAAQKPQSQRTVARVEDFTAQST